MAKATNNMIVHHAGGLHIGVDDRRTDETEAAPLEVAADCLGQGRAGRNLIELRPCVQDRYAIDERPDVGGEAPPFFFFHRTAYYKPYSVTIGFHHD